LGLLLPWVNGEGHISAYYCSYRAYIWRDDWQQGTSFTVCTIFNFSTIRRSIGYRNTVWFGGLLKEDYLVTAFSTTFTLKRNRIRKGCPAVLLMCTAMHSDNYWLLRSNLLPYLRISKELFHKLPFCRLWFLYVWSFHHFSWLVSLFDELERSFISCFSNNICAFSKTCSAPFTSPVFNTELVSFKKLAISLCSFSQTGNGLHGLMGCASADCICIFIVNDEIMVNIKIVIVGSAKLPPPNFVLMSVL
jgi:hypothetical protein